VGGRGKCLRAEKTRSEKTIEKSRRIPHVHCTLCWATCQRERWLKKDDTANTTKILHATLIFTITKKLRLTKRLLKKDFAKQTRTEVLEKPTQPKNDNTNEANKILQTQLTRTKAEKKTCRF
jgi:hypothetical protein